MRPASDATEPEVGRPPHTTDAEVNDALADLGEAIAHQPELPVDAKVAAAIRAHQRLHAILTADRG